MGIPKTYWDKNRESLTAEDFDRFDKIICLDVDEHFQMMKEQFPEHKYSVSYLKVKDVFDWEPKETLDTIAETIEYMVSKIRNGEEYEDIFSEC